MEPEHVGELSNLCRLLDLEGQGIIQRKDYYFSGMVQITTYRVVGDVTASHFGVPLKKGDCFVDELDVS